MPNQDPNPALLAAPVHYDHAAIMNKLGQIEGASTANFAALFAGLEGIKTEIRESERRVNARIDGVEDRVKVLEEDNKDQIKSIARHSALAAAVTSALVTGGVEIIKRLAL